jgi:hypothetical protein
MDDDRHQAFLLVLGVLGSSIPPPNDFMSP